MLVRFYELPARNRQRVGNLFEAADGWVGDAAFDLADIGSVKAAIESQFFLGDAFLASQSGNFLADMFLNCHDDKEATE